MLDEFTDYKIFQTQKCSENNTNDTHSNLAYIDVCGGSFVAKSCLTLATPWTVACQVPLSMEFSRQEYWKRLPFPSPNLRLCPFYYLAAHIFPLVLNDSGSIT